MQCVISGYDKESEASVLPARERVSLKIAGFCAQIMTTRPEGLRQSDRVNFRMPVEASWFAAGGVAVKQMAQTLLVSRNGGVLCLSEKVLPGQELTLRRQNGDDWKMARARVMVEFDREPDGFLYAFVILEPREDFWGIDFPAPHMAEDALARLLMECSFCQRREVVYLNELQLKSFEVRKCVARLCTHCDAPSIWIEAQSTAKQEGVPKPVPEERVNPHRKKNRVKARVLACIRRRGFQEEVAVCEDLSKGGLSFCADSHCVFAGAAGRGTLSTWRGVREAADGWRLGEEEDFTTEGTETTQN